MGCARVARCNRTRRACTAHRFNKIRGYRAGSPKRDAVSGELGVVTFAKLAPDTPVTKGETLLKLDDRDQALAVRQAEWNLRKQANTEALSSLNATEANIPQSTSIRRKVTLIWPRFVAQAEVELSVAR